MDPIVSILHILNIPIQEYRTNWSSTSIRVQSSLFHLCGTSLWPPAIIRHYNTRGADSLPIISAFVTFDSYHANCFQRCKGFPTTVFRIGFFTCFYFIREQEWYLFEQLCTCSYNCIQNSFFWNNESINRLRTYFNSKLYNFILIQKCHLVNYIPNYFYFYS